MFMMKVLQWLGGAAEIEVPSGLSASKLCWHGKDFINIECRDK